jgi:hypothetical protein
MQGSPASSARWPSQAYLNIKFHKHGSLLGVATLAKYDASARATVHAGRQFTYTDRQSGRPRVGYFDATTLRFTALSQN